MTRTVLFCLCLAACGGSSGSETPDAVVAASDAAPSGASDGAPVADGDPTSGVDGGGDPGVDASPSGLSCGPGNDPFPAFSQACGADEDCEVGLHQVDCCGTLQALGIATSEHDDFVAAEATCSAMYPACGCASGPTTVDDGEPTQDLSAIHVECRIGVCTTYSDP